MTQPHATCMWPLVYVRAALFKRLFNSRFINVNIFWVLYSFMTVNWIFLGCGQNKTFEDIILDFDQHFMNQTNRLIDKIIKVPLLWVCCVHQWGSHPERSPDQTNVDQNWQKQSCFNPKESSRSNPLTYSVQNMWFTPRKTQKLKKQTHSQTKYWSSTPIISFLQLLRHHCSTWLSHFDWHLTWANRSFHVLSRAHSSQWESELKGRARLSSPM